MSDKAANVEAEAYLGWDHPTEEEAKAGWRRACDATFREEGEFLMPDGSIVIGGLYSDTQECLYLTTVGDCQDIIESPYPRLWRPLP